MRPIIAAIEEKKETQPFVIAIDGRCASGKSTAAALLKTVYPEADLVHMDDFFLPPALRTPARYAEPGGNVDYDRFRTEVSEKLRKGNFAYTRFDCSKMAFGERIPVKGGGLVIIEGSYALHPKLGLKTDLRVFSDVAPDNQLSRIALRDGEEAKKKFVSTWIPLEEAYFTAFSVRSLADITI
ncbi:MAG: uridine kinase [Clostridia bacterium]|nr:uridine kinase [Clostridia bacterium]